MIGGRDDSGAAAAAALTLTHLFVTVSFSASIMNKKNFPVLIFTGNYQQTVNEIPPVSAGTVTWAEPGPFVQRSRKPAGASGGKPRALWPDRHELPAAAAG